MSDIVETVARAIRANGCGLSLNGETVFCTHPDLPDHVRSGHCNCLEVAPSIVRATIEHLSDNITPEMVGAGWGELKRAHLPKLGAGPGVPEAFRAMLSARLKELEA